MAEQEPSKLKTGVRFSSPALAYWAALLGDARGEGPLNPPHQSAGRRAHGHPVESIRENRQAYPPPSAPGRLLRARRSRVSGRRDHHLADDVIAGDATTTEPLSAKRHLRRCPAANSPAASLAGGVALGRECSLRPGRYRARGAPPSGPSADRSASVLIRNARAPLPPAAATPHNRTAARRIARDGAGALDCSFCGKSLGQVKRLIAGQTAYICDECVELCVETLNEDVVASGEDP
jgi:hypothetical protein